ncbi:murein biosynthesis integral membrane protein MurJ [Oceanobacillus halotolerans]|uniref:murein biosynthesis integral membrane protein MurJ n=1 Tax=Oceanobacillus halotolerans TaxID=2663380 RepID=UPI0013DB4FC7|nr:murein biosynthesis integral membrane protein MurJ [Oceanobacillus halotolerans]
MKKAVILVMLVTIISKIIGFLRDITLSYFYGASNISDAFFISLTIPSVIFGVIAAGISTSYIPIYSKIETHHSLRKGKHYTNNLINILFVFCSIIIILGLIFTEPLVKLFASGFEGETLRLAVVFTRISMVGIYFTIIIRILSAYLNYKKLFIVPALIGLPMNIILIAAIILSRKLDFVILLAIGNVIALFVQLAILVYFAYQKQYKYQLIFNIKDPYIRNMVTLSLPVILGSSVTQINKLVDRTLASQSSTGGISALNYAHTLNNALLGIFVASISTVMYPLISKMATKGNIDGLKRTLHQSIIGVSLFLIPATVFALLFAEPIIQLLYGRGAFDQHASTMTSQAFFFYSVGMLGFGLRVLLSRAFYSLEDTRTPMINATIAMVLNIILNFTLAGFLGIGGLALATSLSVIFCTILLFFSLRRKIGQLHLRETLVSFIKISIAAFIMGFISKFLYQYLLSIMNNTFSLFATLLVSLGVYVICIMFAKIKDADNFIQEIRRKIKK